jgi:hypothetical protein
MYYSFIDNYKNTTFNNNNDNNVFYQPGKNNNIKNYNSFTLKEENNNWATQGSIQRTLLQGTYTPTPLGELFFSPDNIRRIQNAIKKEIYIQSNCKYKLVIDQNESDLLVVMRAVYITDAINSPYKIIHQVKELNKCVLRRIINEMITNIKQNEEYLNVIDRPIEPIPLPVNVSKAGRLSLPSVTKTFF